MINNIFKKFIVEQQMIDLEATLRQKGYNDLKRQSSKKIGVLVDGDRKEALDVLMVDLKEYNPVKSNKTNISSIGHIELYPDFVVFVKLKSQQGMKSAGLENEEILANTINNYVQQAGTLIDVIFKSGSKKFICREVTSAEEVGRKTKKTEKADIIINGLKEYRISVKKDNAINWQSADSFWRDEAKKVIERLVKDGDVKLKKNSGLGIYELTPSIAIKASKKEAETVIFGTDLKKGSGSIVTKTFRESDFEFNENKNELVIDCSDIIESLSDVDEDKYPYFFIRKNKGRKTKDFFPGLRILAVYKKRIQTSSVLKVKSS